MMMAHLAQVWDSDALQILSKLNLDQRRAFEALSLAKQQQKVQDWKTQLCDMRNAKQSVDAAAILAALSALPQIKPPTPSAPLGPRPPIPTSHPPPSTPLPPLPPYSAGVAVPPLGFVPPPLNQPLQVLRAQSVKAALEASNALKKMHAQFAAAQNAAQRALGGVYS